MTGDPCAVYNFYNCCHDGTSPANPGTGSTGTSGPFPWQGAAAPDPFRTSNTSGTEIPTPIVGLANTPNANMKAFYSLTPLHRRAQLQDVSMLRFADYEPAQYSGTIDFDLVVMDFAGTVIRTISTATQDYRLFPLLTWTPISLSTIPGDLDVPPDQMVAGQLTFGGPWPLNSGYFALYHLCGTGIFIP